MASAARGASGLRQAARARFVGDGSTFPHCIHHQVANLVGSLDGSPPVLADAAVEGPNGTVYKGALTGMLACPVDGVDVYAPFNGSGAKFEDNVSRSRRSSRPWT